MGSIHVLPVQVSRDSQVPTHVHVPPLEVSLLVLGDIPPCSSTCISGFPSTCTCTQCTFPHPGMHDPSPPTCPSTCTVYTVPHFERLASVHECTHKLTQVAHEWLTVLHIVSMLNSHIVVLLTQSQDARPINAKAEQGAASLH